MNATSVLESPQHSHFSTSGGMRAIRGLATAYAALSVVTLGAIVAFSGNSAMVDSAVWTRGIIVVASSLLTLRFAVRAARGSARAYLRLRIASAVMFVAIVTIISLPGLFPLWMKLEQGVCGALLLGLVIIANRRCVRRLFTAK